MQVRGDPPQFHHDSHDPCWPAPRSSQAWAAWHFVRPVFHLLTWQVELGSTELVVEWTWQQLRHRSGGYAVSWALYVLINSVCPSNGPARPRPGALRCLIHLFVVSSCIRLRREVQGARPARWAARAIRVLPHQWLSQIYHGSEAQSTLRRILDGVPEFPAVPTFFGDAKPNSAVYILFNSRGLYVGKANLQRREGCGLQRRLWEHLHALLHPRTRPGRMGRYELLRQRLTSLCFFTKLGGSYGASGVLARSLCHPYGGPAVQSCRQEVSFIFYGEVFLSIVGAGPSILVAACAGVSVIQHMESCLIVACGLS